MAVSGVKEFELKADPETVMKAVAAVDRLPEWSSAHKKITIESTHDDGRPHRVRMAVSILGINDEQVVDYTFEGDEKVKQREESGFSQSTFKTILDRIEREGEEVC